MLFNGDKVFYGKHAQYVLYLCKDRGKDRDDGVNVFQRVLDLYIIAPLVGLIYNKKAKIDTSSNLKSTIQYAQIQNETEMLTYVYRIVMLLADADSMSEKDRMDRAFRFENDEKKEKENYELFDQYVLGGIEWLYDHFSEDLNNKEAILRHVIELLDF